MASLPLTSLFLATLLIHGCSALIFGEQTQQQQQHRLRARTDCRIDKLTAQEPTLRFDSEAGRTEFWDATTPQFQCAGVFAFKNTVHHRGLMLPHYNNAPQLLYVVKGRGLLGVVIPGCAETFESETQSQLNPKQRFLDRHQKVRQFRQGDVLALPAGLTIWMYNNGEEELVTVSLVDTSNEANQLDQNFRSFFLAGTRQSGREQAEKKSIFYGIEDQILAEIFNVDRETARKLQGHDDRRGHIVRAERFNIVFPGEQEEEYRGERGANGLEETLCTSRLREHLDEPSRADIYNPRGGRIITLNSQKLPILSFLRLSAEKGNLYRNAIVGPEWNVNAHSAIYIIRGSGRFQVVEHTGKLVFDGQVRQGQMIILPQNYVVIKKANDNEGLEWISFKTNDNAITNQLVGRLSAIRALPEEVLMNSYDISRQEAKTLKFRRDESRVFSSESTSQGRPRPLEYAMDVIKAIM